MLLMFGAVCSPGKYDRFRRMAEAAKYIEAEGKHDET